MHSFAAELVNVSLPKKLTKNPSMTKSLFLEALLKAGTGEGSRGGHIIGHTKSGKPIYDSEGRKPYPGEEAHKYPPHEPKEKTYLPPEGTSPHYSDPPEMRAYKNLISQFKKRGMDFQGHITYNPKTKQIYALTPKGDEQIQQIVSELKAKTAATVKH